MAVPSSAAALAAGTARQQPLPTPTPAPQPANPSAPLGCVDVAECRRGSGIEGDRGGGMRGGGPARMPAAHPLRCVGRGPAYPRAQWRRRLPRIRPYCRSDRQTGGRPAPWHPLVSGAIAERRLRLRQATPGAGRAEPCLSPGPSATPDGPRPQVR